MLYWHANFQIPMSGVQAAEVFLIAELNDNTIQVNTYADSELKHHLFNKEYIAINVTDPYDYLLSLDEYKEYKKV